jgi:hypothetical protein
MLEIILKHAYTWKKEYLRDIGVPYLLKKQHYESKIPT